MLNNKSRISINLAHVKKNFQYLRTRVGDAVEIAPAVKANAYGIGALEVVASLRDYTSIFYVATIKEGAELKEQFSNLDFIVLAGAATLEEAAIAKRLGLILVVNSPLQLELMARAKISSIFVNYDTGMGRLGFSQVEFAQADFSNFEVKYLLSHLANSDDSNSPVNHEQLQLLLAGHKKIPNAKLSLSNSGGIMLGAEFHLDQVRPGAALYGVNSSCFNELPLAVVVTIYARVLQIRKLDRAQGIGYNGTYIGSKDQIILTIEGGYADGIHRSLSNRGLACFEGVQLPYIGRISMDCSTLDASGLSPEQLSRLNYVEILGENININEIASKGGTIGYEILTSLKCSRFERVYIK